MSHYRSHEPMQATHPRASSKPTIQQANKQQANEPTCRKASQLPSQLACLPTRERVLTCCIFITDDPLGHRRRAADHAGRAQPRIYRRCPRSSEGRGPEGPLFQGSHRSVLGSLGLAGREGIRGGDASDAGDDLVFEGIGLRNCAN